MTFNITIYQIYIFVKGFSFITILTILVSVPWDCEIKKAFSLAGVHLVSLTCLACRATFHFVKKKEKKLIQVCNCSGDHYSIKCEIQLNADIYNNFSHLMLILAYILQ
jgi:hypothetical protein